MSFLTFPGKLLRMEESVLEHAGIIVQTKSLIYPSVFRKVLPWSFITKGIRVLSIPRNDEPLLISRNEYTIYINLYSALFRLAHELCRLTLIQQAQPHIPALKIA